MCVCRWIHAERAGYGISSTKAPGYMKDGGGEPINLSLFKNIPEDLQDLEIRLESDHHLYTNRMQMLRVSSYTTEM